MGLTINLRCTNLLNLVREKGVSLSELGEGSGDRPTLPFTLAFMGKFIPKHLDL